MLLVQEFLKNKTFGELAAEHGVYASFSKSGHKFSLNYDQIEAKESDPLAQQCRGLILACKDGNSLSSQSLAVPGKKDSYDHLCPGDTCALARPMDRFFNHGQGASAEINWSDPNLHVMEKLDGTLTIVYYDTFTNEWCVATRSVPEADLPLDNGLFTFRTLFEKAVEESLKLKFGDFAKALDPWMTYCFELTTPYNRIVCQYDDCSITLLAVRHITSGDEKDIHHPHVSERYPGVPRVPVHTLRDVNEILAWVSEQNPLQHEGVVIMDSKFNRIKVKNASYIAFNRARDVLGSSSRNCLELILAEKDDDVMAALPPDIVTNLLRIKDGVRSLIEHHDITFKELMAQNLSKKDLALNLKSKAVDWQAPYFQMFDNKITMREFIAKNKKDGSWGNGFLDKMLEIIDKKPLSETAQLNRI